MTICTASMCQICHVSNLSCSNEGFEKTSDVSNLAVTPLGAATQPLACLQSKTFNHSQWADLQQMCHKHFGRLRVAHPV